MDQRLAAYISSLPSHCDDEYNGPLSGAAFAEAPLREQIHRMGLDMRLGALLGAHALETVLLLASWTFVGAGALSGRLDKGWLIAWALCLASAVPLRMSNRWWQGILAVGFGGLLKERLLAGATKIDPDVIRRKGVGELLGEVLEAEEIDRVGASGGLGVVLAGVELALVPVVLAFGAAAIAEIVLLTAFIGLTVFLTVRNTRERSHWTKFRLRMTHRLVEKMAGHRTRAQQQSPGDWHREEDDDLEEYAKLSERLDRSTGRLLAAIPRGYVLAAFVVLTPTLLSGSATTAKEAITLGTALFAGMAFENLMFGLPTAATAWISWRLVKPVSDAASRPAQSAEGLQQTTSGETPIRAQELFFTHGGRTEAAVKGCALTIKRGELLLLHGESGSGKSTLLSLLAGSRRPSSGIVLSGGLDLQTLGEARWRRRIAVVPQYHENHIFSASLAFNLLLARPYPHTAKDVSDAIALCPELGLGPLLERLPSGIDQMVGETGWQLSQGERSRVFIARALLQNPEVLFVDESFAALDPETLTRCLECVIRRSNTLVVVAHP